ncbi:MAG TPA: endolytic transglycosylase MltG [Solirubrobacteraceae bacterium]|nr:endolytic transglycosylase MltG [Solirubrobacteraceae bacterium]
MADSDRSAEEREAARREREAARRDRTGVFNQQEADPAVVADQRQPEAGYAPLTDWSDDGGDGHDDAHHVHEDDEAGVHEGNDAGLGAAGAEAPSGTRRISRLEQRSIRPHKARSVRRRPPHSRRRGRWRGRFASLVALILAGALIWFLVELFQPLGTSPHGSVTVVIPPNSSTKEIGALLQREGVIGHGLFFELRATLGGERGDLRSGTYHLQLGMSYATVLSLLSKAPRAAPTTQLTISEGHTRAYVAALLRKQKIKGNYLAATRHSRALDPRKYGAPRTTPFLEGFLFPDTFTLVKPVKMSALVDDQLKDFKRRFARVNLSYARSKHLSPYEVLTVASLIEAEAASQKARPLIASVIYNRLADHMMLQFDTTTQYATGNYTKPLTVSQLKSNSPYNTHTHLGLPPTPINSPGLASIDAAAHPARTRYLYFFAKPCSNQTVFATSYAQFQHLLAVDRRPHCGK